MQHFVREHIHVQLYTGTKHYYKYVNETRNTKVLYFKIFQSLL